MSTSGTAARALALVAVSALGLTACATSGSGNSNSSSTGSTASATTANTTITAAHEQEFGSYNNNTAAENAVKNTVILNKVLGGFWHFGTDGTVQPDKEFGTFEKTSDNPLTVKYTINDKAVWSDGVPVECSDLVLTWAANSNQFPTGKKNSDGTEGQVFSTASSTGYEDANVPQCNKGDKTATVTYKQPFADWNALFPAGAGGGVMPAHIVEKQAGVPDLIAAVKNKDMAALTKAGNFYNTGWILKSGQLKPEITPSSGPYQISQWQGGQSITLTANPKWWGTPPASKTVVVRIISQDQQAQALQNGEVQVIKPQPNSDLVAQLKNIGNTINIQNKEDFTFEHYDFNFRKGNPFADLKVRQAFAKCLPRETIVDNLVKPVNPNAQVLNSLYALPFQPNYQKFASGNGSEAYKDVDIAGAKDLLGGKTVNVRIGYQTPNPRRTKEVALVRDSCGQAGFKVTDAGQSDFFGNGLVNGNWDVALFAWSGSAIVTSNSTTYTTGGGNNNGKYSNPQVDTLTKQLNSELDPAKQADIQAQLDKIVFTQDLASIPAFAFPGVLAAEKKIKGVEFNPSQSDITWNMDKWSAQ